MKTLTGKIFLASAIFGLALSAGAMSTLAFRGDSGERSRNFDSAQIEEMKQNREEVQSALQAGDYNAWKEAVKNGPMSENVTEENFARFAEMHRLMQAGDIEGAEAIRAELGLPEKGMGFGKGFRQMRMEDKNGDGVCDYQDIQES